MISEVLLLCMCSLSQRVVANERNNSALLYIKLNFWNF